ncbi:hypothetical protein C8A05DRAFT_44989 [Staphylotrichum tortipilum]|uniref:Uncharacterized protein n=1 Tax=Staphylotrichum tortipilum TaxID=2831512 RepID=A0AAN6MI87_9PEZI|nr:hypothetical protein C8A05DRAFT_44989 [Staphylotrichum longicolle]
MATPPSDPPLPGILRLSPALRRRIYVLVGLGHGYNRFGQTAPEVYNLDGDNGERPPSWSGHCLWFFGLLVSCRTIHDEAAALLYSSNWFVIRYHQRRSLASLCALSPPAVANLINLRIVLNQSSCHEKKKQFEGIGRELVSTCQKEWHWTERYHNPLLRGTSKMAQEVLPQWHAAIACLAPHITPGALELSVVCDFFPDDAGVEAAKVLLSSLRFLPRLKDCHIRLCGGRHAVLEELTHEAILHARGIPPIPRSPLAEPAQGLRLRILQHTDLITPWGEVYWSRGQPGYWFSVSLCNNVSGRGGVCTPPFHHGCQHVQCARNPNPNPSIGCFCRRKHAVASSACRCWHPPTSLFLVCRALRREAELVFYGQNRFIVLDGSSPDNPAEWWPAGAYPHKRFAASHFLRTVMPQHCLPHLRFLELVFNPSVPGEWSGEGEAVMCDWMQTAAWMSRRLAIPALTIRVVMAKGELFSQPVPQGQLTQGQTEEVVARYRRIVEPLPLLGAGREGDGDGLGRFYVEMPWPWHPPPGLLGRTPWEPVPWEPELKEELERLSMGERYESVCTSERRAAQSTWFRVYGQWRGPNVAVAYQ